MSEYVRAAFMSAYSDVFKCAAVRMSVCAHVRGEAAGVSAPREADVSDVRGKCRSCRTLEARWVSRRLSCSVWMRVTAVSQPMWI